MELSATTNWDGKYLMQNNYEYSKRLLKWSQKNYVPFIYLLQHQFMDWVLMDSKKKFVENPINMYAYSKFLFDQYVKNF